ncbi:MAG: hypothetical protein ACOVQM_05620, partial [Pirellula sp.]
HLSQCEVDGRSIQKLLPNLKSLKELRADPASLSTLRLENYPQLKHVFSEADSLYTNLFALRLVNMPSLQHELELPPTMKYIYLDQVQSLRGISLRANLPSKPTIRGLRDLKYFAAGGESIDDTILEEILNCKGLEKLTLAYASVSSEMLSRLSELPNLKHIRLPGCKVNDEVIAKWGELRNLTELFLDDTEVTDQGVSQLPLSNLSRLSLRRTKTTSGLLKQICQADRKTPLTWLGIGGYELTEADLKSISDLDTIVVLSLSDLSLDAKNVGGLSSNAMPGLFWLQLQNIRSQANVLLQLSKSARTRIDLIDCDNSQLAMNVLMNEDRLCQESSLETGEFQRQMANDIVAGFRILDLKQPKGYGASRVIVALPKGEIYCDRFAPTGESN